MKLTATERANLMLSLHRQGQQLETALRFAASHGLTRRDVADALDLPRGAVDGMCIRWDVEMPR